MPSSFNQCEKSLVDTSSELGTKELEVDDNQTLLTEGGKSVIVQEVEDGCTKVKVIQAIAS